VLNSIITGTEITTSAFLICTAVSLILGLGTAALSLYKAKSGRSQSFILTLAILPALVQIVIMMVNGNIGAGVAVAGAFGLIRFRSAQGSADELAAILIAMGGGIAFGMGYLGYGAVIMLGLGMLYFLIAALPLFSHSGEDGALMLRITVPENLEYGTAFDETFGRYCRSVERAGVKTTGMGSMFRLSYRVRLLDPREEKAFIDELRTRNGNLEISLLPDAQSTNAQL
jgi:hypothetical protein